jgi:hypothetical protein
MINFHIRNGFGFDIEYNDDVCHVVGWPTENDEEIRIVAAFEGVIVKLPLLAIYIGSWEELDPEVLEA